MSLDIDWRGRKGAPRLILLHGFMGWPEDWFRVTGGMHGWQLGFVRLRAMQADVLADELAAACSEPSAIAGYSMGGRLALHTATRHPGRFPLLLGLSTTAGLRHPAERAERLSSDRKLAEQLRSIKNPDAFEAFLRAWWKQTVFARGSWKPDTINQLVQSRLKKDPAELACQLNLWSAGILPHRWDSLRTFPGTTRFLAGGLDSKYASLAREMAGTASHGEATVIANAGHALLSEAPEVTAAWISSTPATGWHTESHGQLHTQPSQPQ